ncbi:family 78 glycoside hydrolase catalytic domain [Actinoplanes sp. NPDC048796]|uniref:family 78 glycoside hydrolase catalytic domain n=1 Tax=Actinoplanes sp. NPDC048796 TaxID=3155640 RepID=UPI0033D139E3
MYRGTPLRSRTGYSWRVRVFDEDTPSPWSDPATFETGLLGDDRLTARWISAPYAGPDDRRVLYFRTEVTLPDGVVRARAYASALGWYKFFVNGSDIAGHALVPRWTPFDESVEYQVYDVTEVLRGGVNVLGLAVGDGRFRGALGDGACDDARYGDRLGVLLELDLEFRDGSRTTIVTDERWTVGTGAVRRADPVLAVEVDLRVDQRAWLEVGGSLNDASFAEVLPGHDRSLIAEEVERVRDIARLSGTVRRSRSGVQLIDFGQNFAGIAALTLRGRAGQQVVLTYGEVLTPEGELDKDHLFIRSPRRPGTSFQRDTVTLSEEPLRYCPWFTIRGFRYIEVQGAEDLSATDVEGIVLSTDMPEISAFTASDTRLERLWSNARWSLRSNFTDTATDCPQRERSGWTGDLQVFGSTAVQLVAADNFLRRYLRNAAVEQYDDGRVPPYIPSEQPRGKPNGFHAEVSGSVGWGDAMVILPWTLYQYRGDVSVLHAQYPSARKWVDQLACAATRSGPARPDGRHHGDLERYILDSGYHWGEWLRAGEEGINEWVRNQLHPPAVVATAYFAKSSALLSEMAAVLGNDADAKHYAELAENVRHAWRAAFVRDDGARIGEDKQDDYVRALAFDLLPVNQRMLAARRLVELIDKADGHLGTGFLSTSLLLPALVDAGHPEVAYRLLFQTTAPSWLAQLKQGATTMWESWRGYDENGNARDSHNHYALGGVARFLQEYVAGLAPMAPGYREIRFAPTFTEQLGSASVRIQTPYGTASSAWTRTADGIRLEVEVPPGASGVVRLADLTQVLQSGTHVVILR